LFRLFIFYLSDVGLGYLPLPGGKGEILKMISDRNRQVISESQPYAIATNDRSGVETGQVVKLKGIYHMFMVVNEMFEGPHRDLRIAHWTSTDAVHCKGQATERMQIRGQKFGSTP